MEERDHGGRRQLRQPRLAEIVSDALRYRIASGELRDGDMLPKQEELLAEFEVSKPSLREALRILESEGLITVQRGNVGGARVHLPDVRNAGNMIALVLQSRNVPLEDVQQAVRQLEPVCAGLCAARPDRHEEVLPRLRELHEQAVAAIDDEMRFSALSHQFHEALVARCGNQTLIVVAGALESISSARQHEWARRAEGTVVYPGRDVRRSGVKAHERLIELIDSGDVGGVIRVMQKHLTTIEFSTPSGAQERVRDSRPIGVRDA
jgi:DNA-binding FadR family transcriptional regulator